MKATSWFGRVPWAVVFFLIAAAYVAGCERL